MFSGYPIVPSIFLFGSLLSQFAACSAAYVATKWKSPTSKTSMVNECPVGVFLIAVLYVILGLLLSVLASLLFLLSFTVSFEAVLLKPLILVGLILLLVIASVISFLIAYGFYVGRRWAWLVMFASALIGVFSSINQIIFRFSLDMWLIIKILMLFLSAFIFIYLLQSHIRIYFGVVNPSQESTSEASNN